MTPPADPRLTYRQAGVDIDAGDALVDRIKPQAACTIEERGARRHRRLRCLCAIPAGYQEPILVSGTDGVGAKLKVAFASGRRDTIGVDPVAMCVETAELPGMYAAGAYDLAGFAVGVVERARILESGVEGW